MFQLTNAVPLISLPSAVVVHLGVSSSDFFEAFLHLSNESRMHSTKSQITSVLVTLGS